MEWGLRPSPPAQATHGGASAVLPPLGDLCLVGVVGTADHGAGGGQAPAPPAHGAAAGFPARQPLLLQLCVPRAGRAALRVQRGRGRATWWRAGPVRAAVTETQEPWDTSQQLQFLSRLVWSTQRATRQARVLV